MLQETTEIKNIHEMAFLLDMLFSFFITCYKMGLNEPYAIKIVKEEIIKRIQNGYMEYDHKLKGVHDEILKEIREFTATFLLKTKFTTFWVYHSHSIGEIVNIPFINFIFDRQRTTKIYYEVFDNMILIPTKCINFLIIKPCVYHLTNNMIRYINSKYLLKRSTGGFGLFDYVRDLMGEMFSQIDSQVWMSWSNFKMNYFQSLFSVMYNFKKKIHAK